MKQFFKGLVVEVTFSLVAIPAVILGMATTGYLWEKKVKPYLDKKLGT